MLFFDLFRRPRPRRAPGPCRRDVRCCLELLESRLAPTGGGPVPAGGVVPAPTPTQASLTTPAPTGQPLPAVQPAVTAGAGVDYTVTCSSDAQAGTGWNGGTPSSTAPGVAQGAAVPVSPAAGSPAYVAAPAVAGVTCSGSYQDGQGWALPTPQPCVPTRAVDAVFQQGVL